MYEPACKQRILQLENHQEQQGEFQDAIIKYLLSQGGSASVPFLMLKVRPCGGAVDVVEHAALYCACACSVVHGNTMETEATPLHTFTPQVQRGPTLIADTLDQIQKAAAQDGLKKPLKVQFVGEDGIDEGGVQKV